MKRLITSTNKTLRYLLIGIVMSLFPLSLWSQYHSVNVISSELTKVEKGLSQNSVRCILKDKQGFMWFGTWDGLNRYDGIDFRILSYDLENQENSISSQTVNCILQDSLNNIWIGTLGGVNIIDPKTLDIRHVNHLNGLQGDTVLSLYLYKNKYLFVGTNRGIQVINTLNLDVNNLSSLFGITEFDNKEIRSIHQEKKDVIWVGTNKGLYCLNLKTAETRHFSTQTPISVSNDNITSIASYKDSLIFIGTEKGFNIYNVRDKKMEHIYENEKSFKLGNDAILSLMIDHKNILWIGTSGGGVSIYDITKGVYEPLKVQFSETNKLKANIDQQYIHCLYESDDQIIWIGTAWNGVVQLNSKPLLFKHFYKFSKNNTKSSADRNVWALMDLKNEIWVGTENGVKIYNTVKHEFSHLGKKEGLQSIRIRSLFEDSRGTIWIGTFQGGLHAYNPIDKSMRVYRKDNKDPRYSISNNTVWKITEDKNQNLWLATYNGLNRLSLRTGEIKMFFNSKDEHSLSNNKVYSVYIDHKNTLWVGTYNGLNKFNAADQNFTVYKHIKGDSNSLSTNRIFDLYQDTLDNLWIGTQGGGLNRFNIHTHKVKFFTEKDGLSNNVVYNILPDQEGGLWMSTNQGINYINLFTERIRAYELQDGLQGLEYNLGSALKDDEGALYFGGTNGFNVFDPSDINQIYQSPSISATSIEVMGKEILSYVQEDDTLVLKYDDNSFSITFAALNYQNAQQIQYKYQLLNYDKSWTYVGSNDNKAVYNRVSPGTYVFQIYSAGSDQNWGSLPLKIYIKISPPWYQTWLFRIAFVILMSVSIYVLVNMRIKRLKNKHKVSQKLYELERQSLRLQMNPHFIFNTLNSIQSYVLNNKQDDSIQYLSKFSKLMRMMLSASRENEISISDELQLLKYYIELERLRFETPFDYRFEIDDKIDQDFVDIPPMVLQPYIENAIIHGLQAKQKEDGMLLIKMLIDKDFIKIKIEDNGIGRVASQTKKRSSGIKHDSKGMLITKERLELLNKDDEQSYSVNIVDYYDDNGKASGTCVELKIRFDDND